MSKPTETQSPAENTTLYIVEARPREAWAIPQTRLRDATTGCGFSLRCRYDQLRRDLQERDGEYFSRVGGGSRRSYVTPYMY
jgi:hypothetical protein